MRIVSLDTHDLRFPTSTALDGSDAMNPDPDYSAAYVVLKTDGGLEGHGLTFTIGRGNEVVCAAITALESRVAGLELDWIAENPGRFWRHVIGDSQLRWIGPDKGAMHLATGAVVNAVWDLLAKAAGKPVWQLVGEMSPEQLVSIIDFRYLTDAVTPEEALAIFRKAEAGKAERIARLQATGYPCYTTSAGWLGYSNEKLTRLASEDPSFRVASDPESGQTIIKGMGELHLEIIVDRMKREFKVEANVGKPMVAYRESIRKEAEAECKFVRQCGGRGQYGHVVLTLGPG